METILVKNERYISYQYELEKDFENDIVKYSHDIFGDSSIYVDIKKKIGGDIVTIPDGYLIDFTIEGQPKLYIVENELVKHDPYRHIGQQVLKFAISYKQSGRKIKKCLLEYLQKHSKCKKLVDDTLIRDGYRNIDALLEHIIFEKTVGCIVIIDESTNELENVLSQLTMKTDILQFKTYVSESGEKIHLFDPFFADVREVKGSLKKPIETSELDTIVVPARKEGFEEVFIGENRWYSIRMSAAMIEQVKYIAAYQVSPISAITHVAEIASIVRYENTNKYLVNFKEEAYEIEHIVLPNNSKGLAPQSLRYTSMSVMKKAKTLADIF